MEGVLRVDNATAIPAGLRPIHELLTSHGWTNGGETAGAQQQQQQQQQRQTQYGAKQPSHTNAQQPYLCELTYVKDPSNDDEFRIRTTADKVTVAVPVVDAPFLYASSFKSYFTATEFVGKHLETYEKKSRNRQ